MSSRLPQDSLVDTSRKSRLESRSENLFPDAVSCPVNSQEIYKLFQYANTHGAQIAVAYGNNGTWLTNRLSRGTPILLINTRFLIKFDLDENNKTVTFGSGMSGVELEIQLRAHGYSLGHFVQLADYPILCDLVANLVSGLENASTYNSFLNSAVIETPSGTTVISSSNQKYADLRERLLGEKQPLSILSQVTVSVVPLPSESYQDEYASKFTDIQREAKAVFSIHNNQIIPLNKLAQQLLDGLGIHEYQSLQNYLLELPQKPHQPSNWNGYCVELDSSKVDSSDSVAQLFPQEVGSSAWLQYKFDLTAREGDVCYLMLHGRGDKEIAKLLNISYWTVRTHVSNILKKFGITSRNEIGLAVLNATFAMLQSSYSQ